jgi:hypothetical protein
LPGLRPRHKVSPKTVWQEEVLWVQTGRLAAQNNAGCIF